MARFLTEEAKAAFGAAVQDVETRSSAEIVIAVRERSADYRDADLMAGAFLAYATLGVQLFSSWTFPLQSILGAPLLVGMAGVALASRAPFLQRLLTSSTR